MTDSKTNYSNASSNYIEEDVAANILDQERYERSKVREARNNDNTMIIGRNRKMI